MRYLLFVILLGFSSSLFAQEIDVSDLTPEQKAAIQLQIEQQRKNNAYGIPDREEMTNWAEWGQGMGVALASTAKEMGVAVDEFSKTAVGKVTIAVIVYKIIGRDIIKFFVGFFGMVFGLVMWGRYYRRMCLFESEHYHENGKLKERIYSRPKTESEHVTRFVMLMLVLAIVGFGNLIIFI